MAEEPENLDTEELKDELNAIDEQPPTQAPDIEIDEATDEDLDSPRPALFNRNQLTWAVWAFVGLAVLLVLILAGRSVHHHLTQKTPAANTGNHVPAPPNVSAKPKSTTSTNNSSGSTNSSAHGTTAKTTPSKSIASTAKTMPNTGPGNPFVVFAGAFAVGSLIHFVASARRRANA